VNSVRSALRLPGRSLSLPVGSLFGISFVVNWSGLLLFALVMYVAYVSFGTMRLGLSTPLLWLVALVAAFLSVLSLYAHELAHALVARAFGIPVRTISLFLLGGMAHISRESPSPRGEFLIAVVGPATSLAVGVVGMLLGWQVWTLSPVVAALGVWLAFLNIPLAIFNLVPAFPLDGGRMLRAMLWFAGDDLRWGSTVAARVGQIASLALLCSGIWILFDGSLGAMGGLWLILIAWFMYAGAASAQHATLFQESLRRLTVAAVMDREFGRVEAETTMQAFAAEYLQAQVAGEGPPPGRNAVPQTFAVYREDALVGVVSLRQLAEVPPPVWQTTAIGTVMQPIEETAALDPSAPAIGALHLLLEEDIEQVAVMAEGTLLGTITRSELARAGSK
jgi:Zn-dependent protease